MEELKVDIQHKKTNKNATETSKKICSVSGQGERWTQIRTLNRLWSRYFKSTGEMPFTQKNSKIST